MRLKKLCAVILSALIIFSAVFPPVSASADIVDSTALFTDTVTDNSGYNITYVKVTNGTAHITCKTADKCKLVVGAYDIASEQMLMSECVAVEKSENDTVVDLSFDTAALPEKFDVKCFLLSDDNSPLCDSYYVADVFIESDNEYIPEDMPLSHKDDKSGIIASGSCSDDDSILWELHSSGNLIFMEAHTIFMNTTTNTVPHGLSTTLANKFETLSLRTE